MRPRQQLQLPLRQLPLPALEWMLLLQQLLK
jgi:hypothetical protein